MAFKTTPDKKDKLKMEPTKSVTEINIAPVEEIKTEKITDVTKKQKILKKKNVRKLKSPPVNKKVLVHPPTSAVFPHPRTISYPPVMSIAYGALPVVTTMSPYFPVSINGYNYPSVNWNSIVTIPSPTIYSVPVPTMPVIASQILATQVCPYTTVITTPILAEPIQFSPSITSLDNSFEVLPSIENVSAGSNTEAHESIPFTTSDPGSYLKLPRDLFPTARMLSVDPNPIIDQLCRESGVLGHSPWILDIEFGLPRLPVTRPIATYNTYFNSIHCKNTPGAIHPGFESCSQDFKRIILFYYDCIISGWYRGFMMMNYDGSVANFQSWLQIPMQVFGLCWP